MISYIGDFLIYFMDHRFLVTTGKHKPVDIALQLGPCRLKAGCPVQRRVFICQPEIFLGGFKTLIHAIHSVYGGILIEYFRRKEIPKPKFLITPHAPEALHTLCHQTNGHVTVAEHLIGLCHIDIDAVHIETFVLLHGNCERFFIFIHRVFHSACNIVNDREIPFIPCFHPNIS
ncbi:hypothetical protein SDC9_103803 [bioreactor metagenome]|uniref:Uncharacterized protein n=1 Tax=bioreactor metagenome TaxID=1076179 RepID=A0A645AW14_9ZZZZ